MNLLTIAIKNIRQRMLASLLTSLSVAIGVMLMVTVLVVNGIVEKNFSNNSAGYNLVVGRKGSELDLVMSTMYRFGKPIENLPYQYYQELKKLPFVADAIPFAIGDYTQKGGFPIVGTTARYFELEYAPGKDFLLEKGGAHMTGRFDAIVGANVARGNDWKRGDKFQLLHGGADAESNHAHDEMFTVVGILAPTGTANDKTVFIQLDGFYQIAGHEKPAKESIKQLRRFYGLPTLSPEEMEKEVARLTKGDDGHHQEEHHLHEIPDEMKEVTAVLLRTKPKYLTAEILWKGSLKKGYQAQAANPTDVMQRLKNTFILPFKYLMYALTTMIIIVSGISIFVSIYNSMADRKREIAIMRALGAQRQTVFSIILIESIILCLCGGIFGVLFGHGLTFIAAPLIEFFIKNQSAGQIGLVINPWAFEPLEMVLIPAMILLASLAGFIPGLTAYHTDVAEALSE
ncbi:hypothetical protein MNBD_PLANCTO02-1109 [hydrothermal vent metagenome]|uniref:ABC-type antimicrobial peptide transport system, permease component n=1 Tax=hydrothermal vent metagenome TaxID=652676 RepID=A0A3B1E6R3_9ZZZZ